MDSSTVAPLVWTQIWQVTALVVFVLIVNRWTANRRPHLSHLLWAVVLLKCLTPPLVAAPWSVFGWAGNSLGLSASADVVTPTVEASDGYWSPTSAYSPAPSSNVLAEPFLDPAPIERSAGDGRNWMLIAGILWATITFLMFVMLAWRCGSRLREVLRMRLDETAELDRMIHELTARLHLQRKVRLVVTRCNVGPAVFGLLRPTIILPEMLVVSRNPSELEPVLAHELIHVRRGDLWVGAMQWIVQSTWWFHPLVWFGNRLMNRDAERCCDEEVIAELHYAPAEYARMLLDVLSRKQELSPMPLFPGVRPVDVTSQRLERIMRFGQGSSQRTPRSYWLLAIVFALLVLPASWVRLTAQEHRSAPAAAQAVHAENAGDVELTGSDIPDGSTVKPSYPMSYRLDQVMPRLHQSGVTVEGLIALLKRDDKQLLAGVSEPAGRIPKPQYAFFEASNSLIANHTREGHERIAKMLQMITQFGLNQISIETRVISVTPEMTARLGIRWQTLDGSSRELVPTGRVVHNNDLPPRDRKAVSTAVHTVEKHLPVLFATTSPQQTRALLEKAQGDVHTNILTAPKVTLFNGQTAQVADIVQKPFVVGVHNVEGEDAEPQPLIRLVDDGWRLTLRAIQLKDSIWLDCATEFSSLRNVESYELPIQHQGKPLGLQVPEAACSRMQVKMAVEDAHSLLLYGMRAGENLDDSLIVLITPQVIQESTPETPSAATSLHRERYRRHQLPGGIVNNEADTNTPPGDEEIIRALESQMTSDELIQSTSKPRHVRIIKEKIAQYVDPPRHYPLVGSAQLHHAHYKCTVYFDQGGAATRQAAAQERSQVVYVDATHLLRVRRDGEAAW